MTTVPGHNQIMQQAGVAQELSQQAHSPKPSPDQAAALQQAQETVQNTTVQGSEESVRLKQQKEKKQQQEERKLAKARKRNRKKDLACDPNSTGRLLDTTI